MKKPHVVVVGGGACGMSAALALVEAGIDVTVLERERLTGGLCGTETYRGFRFDFGGHRFITRSATLEERVMAMVGRSEMLERRRSSVILHRGERYRYPLDLIDVVSRFGLRRGTRAVVSYAAERVRQRMDPQLDRSFEDWVVHRFGRTLYDAFFGPYTHKLWGIAPDTIAADWAAERISLLDLEDVLLRLFHLRRSPDGSPRTYARRYLYPRRGIGQIFERMAELIEAGGGRVILGAEVVGLGMVKDRPAAIQYRSPTGDHELDCDWVISTMALPQLVSLVGRARGQLPQGATQAASRLRFRGIRLLHLLLNRPMVTPHTWMYVSEPRYLAARIQEPRHRSPDAAPPGQTSLMLEIPCDVGDAVWSAPEAEIFERCMDDLAHLGLRGLRHDLLGHFDSFVREGYPIYHLEYRRDRASALAYLDELDHLLSCGRQGAFRYIFMDTAMQMGEQAAQVVLGRCSPRSVIELGRSDTFIEGQVLTA